MAFFLGVYSKNQFIGDSDIKSVVDDFGCNGSRNIYSIKRPGFHLYLVEKFKQNLLVHENQIGFLAGWLDNLETPLNSADYHHNIFKNYEEDPTSFLQSSEGAFALTYYDNDSHTLHLANDRFGMSPLFIYENENYIYFSNEYEPLVHAMEAKEINADAIAEFFVLGTTLGGKTFFRNIENLKPATIFTASGIHTKQNSYWKPNVEINQSDIQQQAKEMWDLFNKVNQQVFNSQKIETALLTAGADSRVILATLRSDQRNSVRFYTSNLSHLAQEEDQDVFGAKLLAQRFNLRHVIEKISYYENEFDENYFSSWRVLRFHQVYGGWHGGEFMGGFCVKAAPVSENLNENEVNMQYRKLFSRKFRKQVRLHPWDSYIQNKEAGLLFSLRQFTQSFFTTIYKGSRGHWLQPFQLVSHGYSPFWDSRIIKKILSVPAAFLNDYHFYNELMKNAPAEFLNVGSNSPLTKRNDSVLSVLQTGVEPKLHIPNVHANAFARCIRNPEIWKKKFYKQKNIKKILSNENDPMSTRWLDFEIWYTEYMKL